MVLQTYTCMFQKSYNIDPFYLVRNRSETVYENYSDVSTCKVEYVNLRILIAAPQQIPYLEC